MNPKSTVTKKEIIEGLKRLGLKDGDIVIAHSSLKSFGHVEGGADAVIDALLAVVGHRGTVCMPTLTWGDYGPDNPPPLFDPETNPGIVGKIPEMFRRRPEAKRSAHPTHSIAAIGPGADELIKDHEYSETPCGPDSPWGKIAKWNGYVLMIGCGIQPLTMSHGPEEVVHKNERCTPPVPCQILTEKGKITVMLRLHASCYDKLRTGPGRGELEDILDKAGYLRRTKVGDSIFFLIEARGVWEVCLKLCRENPVCLPHKRQSRTTDALSNSSNAIFG